MSNDGIKWTPHVKIEKYSPEDVAEITRMLGYEPLGADLARLGVDPYAILEVEGNQLVTGGLGNLTNLFIGNSGNTFTQAKGITAVGDSTTAFAQAQTDVQAATNKYYMSIDASPGVTRVTTSVTNDTVQAVSTYGTAVANFAWQEWCWGYVTSGTVTANATSLATCGTGAAIINRKVVSMGTKSAGASWVFTTSVQFS